MLTWLGSRDYIALISTLGGRGRWISEFEASLVYMRFQATQGYTVRTCLPWKHLNRFLIHNLYVPLFTHLKHAVQYSMLFIYSEAVSSCNLACPGVHYVNQAGLKLTRNSLASASQFIQYFKKFIFKCVCACVCVSVHVSAGAPGGQKRALEPLS